MKRQFYFIFIMIMALLLIVATACGKADTSDFNDEMDIVVGTDEASPAPVEANLPEDNDTSSDEPETPPDEPGNHEHEGPLDFDQASLNLGKTFSDIEKAFPDLTYAGYLSGGEYYNSPSAKKFFVFDSYEISDPNNPNKNAKTTAFCAAANLIFPELSSKMTLNDIAGIVGKEPFVEEDTGEGDDLTVTFKYKGYVFWFSNSYDLLPDTLLTVRIE